MLSDLHANLAHEGLYQSLFVLTLASPSVRALWLCGYSVQQGLAGFCVRQDRVPFLQTVSQEKHQAEHIWPKVNLRINYTLTVVIKSHVANWILNVGQIVPLSESHCCFVVDFTKAYFRFHFSGVCDLEYYNCLAMLNICLKRKLEWPQSPLTLVVWSF